MVTQPHAVFDAIADPTRRAILDALRRGERSAGDLASLFPVSRPAVSRHLRVLRQAGLVGERKVAHSEADECDGDASKLTRGLPAPRLLPGYP
jgi:DNA-binding transcriptional ArsR family regulator